MIKLIISTILILSFSVLNAQHIKYKSRPIITKLKNLIELENDLKSLQYKLKNATRAKEKKVLNERIIKINKGIEIFKSQNNPFGKILDSRYLVYENNFIGMINNNNEKNGFGGLVALGFKLTKHISFEIGADHHEINYNNEFKEISETFNTPNFNLYIKRNIGNRIAISSAYLGNSFFLFHKNRTFELKLKYGLSFLKYNYNYILFRQENNSNYSDVISIKDTIRICFNPAIQLKHYHKIGRNFLISENIELGNYFIKNNTYNALQQNADKLKTTISIPMNQSNLYYKIGLGIVYRIYSKYYNQDQEKIKQKMAVDFDKYRL